MYGQPNPHDPNRQQMAQFPPQSPQHPQAGPPAGQQFQGPPGTPPGQPQAIPVPPRKRRGKTWLVLGVVVLVVIGAAAFALYRFTALGVTDNSDEMAAQLSKAVGDDSLTEAELNALDPQGLFFASFKTAAQEPIVNVLRLERDLDFPDSAHYLYDTTFDFGSKQLSYQYQANVPTGDYEVLQRHRCVDGVMNDRVDNPKGVAGGWEPGSQDDGIVCNDIKRAQVGNTDRLNTGGLTKDQADIFVLEILKREIITVKKTELVEVEGRQLLRFAVELTPVYESGPGEYFGVQELMWAFHETGLDPASHPYTTIGAGKNGLRTIMYIDPLTALPVYSQSINTPGLSSEGAWLPDEKGTKFAVSVEYGFPDAVPTLTLEDDDALEMTWPEEDYPPTTQEWKP